MERRYLPGFTDRGWVVTTIPSVKALKGGDAYRAVYTVKFTDAIYVLHAFQKKSKSGIATPKTEITLIRQRLADAERLHATRRK